MARKPIYKLNPYRGPDFSSGFTATDNADEILAEAVVLSIPAGSNLTVEDLLRDQVSLYVIGQEHATQASTTKATQQ